MAACGIGANYADCCVVLHDGQRTADTALTRRLVDKDVTGRRLRVVEFRTGDERHGRRRILCGQGRFVRVKDRWLWVDEEPAP